MKDKMMKQTGKLFVSRLFWTLGFVSILVAVVPYQTIYETIFAQQQAAHQKKHSNVRFSEQALRLESVRVGEDAHGFISVENTGNKIFKEVSVLSNCQCSDIRVSKTAINPGESARIDFTINTKGREEDFVLHFVFKYSEDGQGLFDVFYVTVPVHSPGKVVAVPQLLLFNKAVAGKSFTGEIELRVKDLSQNESVDIVDISVPEWMSANLVKKDAYWQLAITGVFPNLSGRNVKFIQIKTSSPQYPELDIPVIVEYVTDAV